MRSWIGRRVVWAGALTLAILAEGRRSRAFSNFGNDTEQSDGSSRFESSPRGLQYNPDGEHRFMSEEKLELLKKLKFELAFIEDGGYGRSVRTPHKPTSPFQDSLTCLNFGDPLRTHPCAECSLMQYVPEARKGEDVPCHHIPLDQESRTIATLDETEGQEVLKRWLRQEINRLEGELAV